MPDDDVLPTPSVEELVVELAQVVAVGASPAALERVGDKLRRVLSLTCVAYAAAPPPHDRARRLADVLARVLDRLPREQELQRGIEILLGTARGYRLASAPTRREKAAELLYGAGMSATTFLRRHQADVLTVVAEEVLRFEDEFRMRATRQVIESDAPVFTALAVQWLDQFGYYFRIWSDLSGLANDITVYLRRRKREPKNRALTSYHTSSLWYLARFLHNVGRFVDERGGIWMFSDQTIEKAVTESIYLIGWHVPFSDREQSWLALALLLQQPSSTLVLFENELARSWEGRDATEKWIEWLHSCGCDLRSPATDCEVHLVVRHAERYCVTVGAEWSRISSWYRHPPADASSIGSPDVLSLFERFDAERFESI